MAVPVLHRDTHHARPAAGEPMRDLQQIQEQTFQLLQSVLGASPFAGAGPWVPAVDIEETEDSWILEAELPGIKSDDIDIEAHDNEIQITGEIVEKERAGSCAGARAASAGSSTASRCPARSTPTASMRRSTTASCA
jgi:HSP20 family protein